MSFFEFGRSARAKEQISAIALDTYIKKAEELFGLKTSKVTQAALEYRHFLYLVYWNRRLAGNQPIVPTELADKLWHAHILYTRDYAQMCSEIFGGFIHHHPGLDVGTAAHKSAMIHTKELHDHVHDIRQKPGFDASYFSLVETPARKREASARTAGSTRGSSSSRRSDDDSGDVSGITFDTGSYHGHTSSHDHGGGSFGGGHSGGGGSSGGWDSGGHSSGGGSSDSGGGSSCGSSCGGGGCGGD